MFFEGNLKQQVNMGSRRYYLFVFGCLICVAFFLITYNVNKLPLFNIYNYVRAFDENAPAARKIRSILLWNTFFGKKRWDLPEDTLGPEYFRDELKCSVYKCELTNNRELLPQVDMFDAVLFHTAEPFPFIEKVPAQRDPKQLYIFSIMEPPGETKHVLSDENGFYNLTMTYRLDSDILWPYKYIFDIETRAIVAPSRQPKWRKPPNAWNDTNILELWSNKTRTAAWYVSHCDTLSKREKLAEALKKYIDVDVYGKCGELSCPYTAEECDAILDQKYKFYLSFENALCTDYVTEKLYNALQRQVVPVVFGGAEYLRFAPPNSYINAETFSSVEELANYLKFLSNNPAEYMRYFWWRKYYSLGYYSAYCNICEILHSATYQQKSQVYNNIENWWLSGSCRFNSTIKF